MTLAFKDLQAYAKELAGVVREHVAQARKALDERAERAEQAHAALADQVRQLTADNEALRKALDDAMGKVKGIVRAEIQEYDAARPEPPMVDVDAIAEKAAALVSVPEAPTVDVDAIAEKAAALVPVPEIDVDAIVQKATPNRSEIAELVLKSLDLPEPVPGRDGENGKDGRDGRDAVDLEILPEIDEAKSYPRNTYARHAGGLWRSFQTTTGMHGWECVLRGVADIEVRMVDERTFEVESVLSDGERKAFKASMPVVLDQGPYREGVAYEPGDGVTFGGQYWIAQDEPTGKPGEPGSKGWRLAVRKGRDASNTKYATGTKL